MQAMRKGVVSALAALLSLAWVPAQDAPATLQQPQALTGARDAQNKDEIRSGAEGDRANRMTLRLKDRDLREVVQIMQRKANVNIISSDCFIVAPALPCSMSFKLDNLSKRVSAGYDVHCLGIWVKVAVATQLPFCLWSIVSTKRRWYCVFIRPFLAATRACECADALNAVVLWN